jgi:hypothetical protein
MAVVDDVPGHSWAQSNAAARAGTGEIGRASAGGVRESLQRRVGRPSAAAWVVCHSQ